MVLAVDPIGQGEREQYLHLGPDFIEYPTNQHEYLSQQLELNGIGAMSWWLWDEQASLDYLASLPYVNASRMGVAGCSGGGTQASYLAAMDHRIAAASIACYISTFRVGELIWGRVGGRREKGRKPVIDTNNSLCAILGRSSLHARWWI